METLLGKALLAIRCPESEYKPLPANSLAAFKKAIDRRLHYRLHTLQATHTFEFGAISRFAKAQSAGRV
jgi:hypothetical protein